MIPEDLALILSKLNCGQAGGKGTGTFNCPFNMLRTTTLIFLQAGFELEEALTIEYIRTLQLKGLAVVLSKVTAVEDLTAQDNETTDAGSGIFTTSGKMPYYYAFTFRNGWYFDSAIRQLESFGAYDVIYLDAALNIIFTANSTAAKGISVGQIAVDPIKNGDGQVTNFSRLKFQEIYRSERDQELAWLTQPYHDIRPALMDGVNDLIVKIEEVPGNSDTTVVFSIKSAADGKDSDQGWATADLQLLKNDVVVALTALTKSSTTGRILYTGTVSSGFTTGQVLSLRINNATYTTGNVLKGNRVFHSTTDTETVTA